MFKLASLATVALVAADTAAQDEAKYKKEGKKALDKAAKSAVTGSSVVSKHISEWEMPGHGMGTSRTVPTYAEVIADPDTYCTQCTWSGGSFTPHDSDHPKGQCTYSGSVTDTDTVALDKTITFSSAFEGMKICAQESTTGSGSVADDSDNWLLTSSSANTHGAGE